MGDDETPATPPDEQDPEPELRDQPLGVPADADPDEQPLPGLPENEPPAAS